MGKETLRQKQSRFVKEIAKLIQYAELLGYELTFADAYRDPRLYGKMGEKKGYGAASSCHKLRLAMDLNLFLHGEWLQTSDAHNQLGEWWEKQGVDHRWGGRWEDGNHYSFEHEGHK